ncbi:hypothetical protein [Roseomonas haemaphysalidis]|uniref:Uncharacterized protein n=1 Tax=Roseomonas haemaphysalidis TaxID=2768162 RepID=A0ABS3KKY0_9PROT|nr:hypothetical protein [Roseomonas haemaphysalidis]MBO1078129.1 hypothetical protein [Roseomonas haemaphysalidis]
MRHLLLATLLSAATLTPVLAQAAEDRRVEVVNASGRELREFYASNSQRSNWEEDILGDSTLPSGRSVMINIDDGSGACRFDVLAVLEGGRRVEQRNINVCEISRFTVR